MSVTCVAGVLAGGESQRLGRPKALLRFRNGPTLLEHVVTVATRVAEQVVILGQPPQVPPTLSRHRILPDPAAGCGPLAGLCSLLQYAGRRWGLLLACDLPALEAPLLRRLLQTAADRPEVDAVAFIRRDLPEVYEACCALYHPRLYARALQHLEGGTTGLQSLLRAVETHALVPTGRETRALFDVDTPEDLTALGESVS